MNLARYVFSEPYFDWLLLGAGNTLLISFFSGTIALVLGTAIALAGYGRAGRKFLASLFTDVFRNIPPVPMLLLLSYSLPALTRELLGITFPAGMEFSLVVAGLSLNTGAYVSELVRSGLRAVPAEQYEAGLTLGLGRWRTLLQIVLPQAFRVAFPGLSTRIIHNMKNSSVALVLPLNLNRMELMGQSGRIAGQTFAWAEPLVFSTAVYLILAVLVSLCLSSMGKRLSGKAGVSELE